MFAQKCIFGKCLHSCLDTKHALLNKLVFLCSEWELETTSSTRTHSRRKKRSVRTHTQRRQPDDTETHSDHSPLRTDLREFVKEIRSSIIEVFGCARREVNRCCRNGQLRAGIWIVRIKIRLKQCADDDQRRLCARVCVWEREVAKPRDNKFYFFSFFCFVLISFRSSSFAWNFLNFSS